jgi:hypothetical protein
MHVYVVWECPEIMKSRQKSEQWHPVLVTNSGRLDARYTIIYPSFMMLFTQK